MIWAKELNLLILKVMEKITVSTKDFLKLLAVCIAGSALGYIVGAVIEGVVRFLL